MNLRVTYSKSTKDLNDKELWNRFRAGDREAFSQIYYSYAQALLDYSLKITSEKVIVEECMQEMFVELWEKRERFGEVLNIRNYLFTTLRRKILKSFKNKSIFLSHDEFQEFELPLEGKLIRQEENQARMEELHKTIRKLSPLQKEIIYLKYFSDFSFDEIASMLKVNKKMVYNSLSKAMIKFRKALNSINVLLFL